jgi:hypothetical protein
MKSSFVNSLMPSAIGCSNPKARRASARAAPA